MPLINFYYQTSDYYDHILQDIKSAEKSVYIESYIFEYFFYTKNLIQTLQTLQNKGIEVKMVFDGFGSYAFLNKHVETLKSQKINFKVFNPLFVPFKSWRKFKYFSIAKILKIGNRRNHRKLIIIDEKIVYLGSQNWSQNHVLPKGNQPAWQDIGCRIENEFTDDLIRSFRQIWKVSQENNLFRPFRKLIYFKNHNPEIQRFKFNFTFIQRFKFYKLFLSRIRNAKNEITIASAYFLPKRSFIRSLIKAKKRGVNIKIITSGPTDVYIVKMAAQGLYEKLLKVGIPIYEYHKTHFHSKYFLFDNESLLLGSYNMNHRSLLHDLEILYEIKEPAKIIEFNWLIKKDLEFSSPLSLDQIENRPWYVKIISKILYRMRYIL